MNILRKLCDALWLGTVLGFVGFPAMAHEGHALDLVSAFLAPLAGWDHLLMASLFVVVVIGMVRAMAKAVRRKTGMHGDDDQ